MHQWVTEPHDHRLVNCTVQGAGPQVRQKLSRAAYQKAHGDWDQLLKVSTAADIIRQAGYPLEEHEVVSQDGYITRMERIPNKGMPCSHTPPFSVSAGQYWGRDHKPAQPIWALPP